MERIKQKPELPKNPLPIVVIGAGGIVTDAHLPAYEIAEFPVLGIYDLEVEKTQKAKGNYPFVQRIYNDFDELSKDLDTNDVVVDLAIPAGEIFGILERLPDGVTVLIQKPMGENLEEAQRILNICREKKLKSGVNFQLRYAPYCIAARQLINEGWLGDIYDYEIKVCVYTPWHLWDFLFDLPRVEILYHSIHYIDLIRSFAGNPVKIYASSVKHPKMKELSSTRSTIVMDFDDCVQARILTNHGHDFGGKHQESYFKIEGTKGAIKITIGVSLDYPKGIPPRFEYIINRDGKGWRKLTLTGGWFPHAFVGPMAGIQRFHSGEDKVLLHDTEDAFETMKWVEKAYKSSESGGVK
ncbi:Gfo/Idh/MocA family protein [Membranihabitans maritimus]|uniref:Gfo/Idh/MocA family protein n=1 Tax=Membranihabitans maritimus TaxID=2904244 RepID=UPI001F33B201|nr:Gfo/Idh/MocA family oxidoreductase [Membranihabitans maritimus]